MVTALTVFVPILEFPAVLVPIAPLISPAAFDLAFVKIPFVAGSVFPDEDSFSMIAVLVPFPLVIFHFLRLCTGQITSLSLPFAVAEFSNILFSPGPVEGTLAMHLPLVEFPFVVGPIRKIEGSLALEHLLLDFLLIGPAFLEKDGVFFFLDFHKRFRFLLFNGLNFY